MNDCKYLKIEDVTSWHEDVYDHPSYKYTCEKRKNMVIPFIHCKKCKNYPKSGKTESLRNEKALRQE